MAAGAYSAASCFMEMVLMIFKIVQVARKIQTGARRKPVSVPAGEPANGNSVSPNSFAYGDSKAGMINVPAATPAALPNMAGRHFR